MFPDRDQLQDSYDGWLKDVRGLEKTLKRQGHAVQRVIVDPDELAAWCVLQGLEPIGSARANYVSEMMAQTGASKTAP